MAKRGRPPHPDVLTPREWEVLGCIRDGLSNDEIAARLGISLDGVKYHVTEILTKLGLENRHDAARWQPEKPVPALAPLLFWRRLGARWLSPAIVGGVAFGIAAGFGLLVWALLNASGGNTTDGSASLPASAANLIVDRPSATFSGIDFAADDEGWMLAGGGLLHSNDGGSIWNEIARVSGVDVDFADSEHGWIVGGGGLILASSDGGRSWSRQVSGTAIHLSDVYAVSPSEAWAVGDGQGNSDNIAFPLPTVLLHTTDGGSTWTQIPTPAGAWFSQLTFLGDEGWVLGTGCDRCGGPFQGMLLHTTDGGQTWTTLLPTLPDSPRGMSFVDGQHGWLIGSCLSAKTGCLTSVFRTMDGGQAWTEHALTGYRSVSALAFRDDQTGWLVASEEKPCPCKTFILATTDGGETWERRAEVPSGISQYARSLHVRGDRLYVLGSQLALVSRDAGQTLDPMNQPAVALGSLDFVDRSVGFSVVGDELFRTENGGLTWSRVGPAPDPYGGRVDFIDAKRGFAVSGVAGVGGTGSALRTEDGGRHWNQISRPADLRGDKLAFIDREHGWLFSQHAIYVTEDGGRTWYASTPEPHGIEFKNMEAIDGRTAWAVVAIGLEGDARRLLRTIDGGRTWKNVRELLPWQASVF